MAIPGNFSTYDLPTGVKLDIEDAIYLISPYDVPLQGAQGADGRVALATETCFEKKVEWLDETLLTPKTTLATGQGGAFTTTTTTGAGTIATVATGTGIYFQTGDVILVGSEYVQVNSYGTTADTLLLVRGYAGSTPNTAATGATIIGVGSGLPESSVPPSARAVDRTDRFNYTQIFGPIGVSVSGSEQAVQKYGLRTTEFDHQAMNRTRENFIAIEQALLYGTQYVGTNALGRTMGGLTYYITSNVDSSSTELTDTTLLTNLENCFDAGGTPDRIVLSSYQKRNLSQLNAGVANVPSAAYSSLIRYTQGENTRGQVVDYYESDFGRLSVVLDRWCRKTDAFIFSRDQAVVSTLRPMTFEMLAKTGDFVAGEVLAEKTLKFRRQSWAAWMSALT